jgi:hypothetical protein
MQKGCVHLEDLNIWMLFEFEASKWADIMGEVNVFGIECVRIHMTRLRPEGL